MSGLPLVLEGTGVRALVVGGGRVAERKVRTLIECGVDVRLVAPAIAASLCALADEQSRLTLVRRAYESEDIGDAVVVVAATADRGVNARVAADARAHARLINVADAPEDGNFVTVASHHAGALTVGISAGGVPTAAVRIRDAVARRLDGRYGAAVAALAVLRRRLLADGAHARWHAAERELIGADFCDTVERGEFAARAARWESQLLPVRGSRPGPEDVAWG